jgi:formate hydrogenlyase transcriptional activator
VRELQNVIERAVITARNNHLNLDRALPSDGNEPSYGSESAIETTNNAAKPILRIRQLEQLERENILRALDSSGWRVAGKDGAAMLLGMNPSTLNSRIRALKIQRRK